MNSVEWNPKHNLLAYAGDDKNKYQADEGILVFLSLHLLSFGSKLNLCLRASSLTCVFIHIFFKIILQVSSPLRLAIILQQTIIRI